MPRDSRPPKEKGCVGTMKGCAGLEMVAISNMAAPAAGAATFCPNVLNREKAVLETLWGKRVDSGEGRKDGSFSKQVPGPGSRPAPQIGFYGGL